MADQSLAGCRLVDHLVAPCDRLTPAITVLEQECKIGEHLAREQRIDSCFEARQHRFHHARSHRQLVPAAPSPFANCCLALIFRVRLTSTVRFLQGASRARTASAVRCTSCAQALRDQRRPLCVRLGEALQQGHPVGNPLMSPSLQRGVERAIGAVDWRARFAATFECRDRASSRRVRPSRPRGSKRRSLRQQGQPRHAATPALRPNLGHARRGPGVGVEVMRPSPDAAGVRWERIEAASPRNEVVRKCVVADHCAFQLAPGLGQSSEGCQYLGCSRPKNPAGESRNRARRNAGADSCPAPLYSCPTLPGAGRLPPGRSGGSPPAQAVR